MDIISQLFIGSIIICISIGVEVLFIFVGIIRVRQMDMRPPFIAPLANMSTYLTGITLWLLAAFSLVCWIWAILFFTLGVFPDLESSLYFAMVAFTSLGLGDLVLPTQWRILSGMIAANGLILFGLNTAILVEVLRELLATFTRDSKHK